MINQKEFVDMLYEDINGDSEEKAVTKKALFEMINTVFDGIQRACKLYDGVKFNNFGNFEVRTSAERIGRNPRTKEEVVMQPRKRIHFRTGKGFKEFLEV